MEKWLEGIGDISRRAGRKILEIYESADFGIETKADDSPLTLADLAAHREIIQGLKSLTPDVPVLSEESEMTPYRERASWQQYWLVDPLDGTREFISRNGEFTVNIALISHGSPLMGVVYVPVTKVLYSGTQIGRKRAAVNRGGIESQIEVRKTNADSIVVVASRRHGSEALASCLNSLSAHFARVETRNMGSSLKLCLVAEGVADFYPRLAPTCEWDTAAAQAVVEAAGGLVVDRNFVPLRYNGREDVLNPHFYVIADKDYPWREVFE